MAEFLKDEITLKRIAMAHPKVRNELFEIYDEINQQLTGRAKVRFTSTFRSFHDQAEIYAQGRTKPGSIVSNAGPGLSVHNYGLAVDIVLMVNGKMVWDAKSDFDGDGKSDWLEIVTIFKQYGWEWGGDWKFLDLPHFQKTFGLSVRQMLSLSKSGRVDSDGFILI